MSGHGFHVHGPHDHEVEHVAHHGGDGFTSRLAVLTAVLSTIGALFGYMGGHSQNNALLYKNEAAIQKTSAANQWNYYQAKSSRQNLAELASHIPGVDAAHYQAEIERYKRQKEEVRKQAETLEATSRDWDHKSEEALHQHHRWAQAMTAIQIAISLAAITLLTRKEWLKRMSYTAGGVAVMLGGLAWLHL